MTTLRDLPNGHYVLAALDDTTCAAVPHDDPLAPLARRWLNGNRGPGDREALGAWLAAQPAVRGHPPARTRRGSASSGRPDPTME